MLNAITNMTVEDLIKKLEKMPKNAGVVTPSGETIRIVKEKVIWPDWSLDSMHVVVIGQN